MIKIAASILTANFANLSAEVESVRSGGAHWLHADVMDGLFVPNISIGLPVVKALADMGALPVGTHLMITKPGRYVRKFCRAGSSRVTFHVEADEPENILAAIKDIEDEGCRAGLSIKPKSPPEVLLPYIALVDAILVMTVEPGFGGQELMPDQLDKISRVREMVNRLNPSCDIAVDGGIDASTAALVKKAGANVLVAGSAIFGKRDKAAAIKDLIEA